MESLKDWAYVISHGAMAVGCIVAVFWMVNNWELALRLRESSKPANKPVIKLKR